MSEGVRPIRWLATSRSDLKKFPADARRQAGHQLWLVHQGEMPDDYKYLGDVGGGVYEIRIHTQREHRVVYVAKFAESIFVLHVFEKRTRKTSRHDIDVARRRYAALLQHRNRPP